MLRTSVCHHCCVVPIKQGDRYCNDCTQELIDWLYAADQQLQDVAEEREYLLEVERKHEDMLYGN